jgi:hypothetical protein
MRNIEKMEQGGLLDLILREFVCMIVRKCPFPYGVQNVCIKGRGIIDNGGIPDQVLFPIRIIRKIWTHPEGNYVLAMS